jgi:hypothetical protein
MRRTMIIEEDGAPASAQSCSHPAQNLSMPWQNQSPRTGAGRDNPAQKMMLRRPVTIFRADARNKNETDCDGSFTAAPRTLHRESPFSFHRHRSAAIDSIVGATELRH